MFVHNYEERHALKTNTESESYCMISMMRAVYRMIRVASARPLEQKCKRASRVRKERSAAKHDTNTTYYQTQATNDAELLYFEIVFTVI